MSKKYYSYDKNYTHIGEFFRDKRKDSGVTQQDLAAALNISKRQIIRFEQGTPINSTYLLKIMFILKITSIHSIFMQVGELKELNNRLGVDPTAAERKVLEKTYNL